VAQRPPVRRRVSRHLTRPLALDVILQVSHFDRARQITGGARRVDDAQHVGRKRLVRAARQQLERRALDRAEPIGLEFSGADRRPLQ